MKQQLSKLLAETVRSCNRDEGFARGQCGLRVNPGIPRVYRGPRVSRLALSTECRETTTSPTPGTANLRRAIKSRTSHPLIPSDKGAQEEGYGVEQGIRIDIRSGSGTRRCFVERASRSILFDFFRNKLPSLEKKFVYLHI